MCKFLRQLKLTSHVVSINRQTYGVCLVSKIIKFGIIFMNFINLKSNLEIKLKRFPIN